MPYSIDGWVEAGHADDPAEPHSWRGVVRLGPLVDVADGVSERLFGLSRRQPIAGALFAGRGWPASVSAEAEADRDRIAAHEAEFGPGECGGYTHATWAEVASSGVEPGADSDWRLVFDLLGRLAADPRFPADRLRLVVWFDW